MRNFFYLIPLVFLILPGLSCSSGRKYDIASYFSKEQSDSLLVDVVTFIGRKPEGSDWQTKYDPVYRNYYIRLSAGFSFEYYYISPAGVHYFYMIRPARHKDGNRRGVGGMYRIGSDGTIVDFEEVFNTPVKSEAELREIGKILFSELVKTGNVERFSENRNYIEWPDDRLKYDKVKKEWRYDVE